MMMKKRVQTSRSFNALDKVHCHFNHSFDIIRLTKNEKQRVNDTETKSIDDNDGDFENVTNESLKTLKNILNKKKKRFQELTKSNRFGMNNNKFSTDLGQVQTDKSVSSSDVGIRVYSYSYNFKYWEHCKTSTEIEKDGLKIATLSKAFIKNRINYAEHQQKSSQCSMMKAYVDEYIAPYKGMSDHPSKYGYKDGDTMNIQHLMVINIYCSKDYFQRKFSQTYRKMNKDDDFETIKKAHSNFHHFAKNMKEAVEVFGTEFYKGNVEKVYHGIMNEMIFDGMQPHIYTAVSTTCSSTVATQFTENNGLVLEIVPHGRLKSFDCCWLSRYSNEAEILFIGGLQSMNFISITNTVNGEVFTEYVTALRIIDSLTYGGHFCYDANIRQKIWQKCTAILCLC
eukprot:165011_1